MVPSSDIRPTEAQREIFRSNFGRNQDEWGVNTPSLSSVLCTGLHAAEYTIADEPFSGCLWGEAWSLFRDFAALD